MYVKFLASLVIGAAAALGAANAPAEELPQGLTVVALEAEPQAIELTHKFDYRQLFVQDVQPAFSKMGCNAGTCHGSQDGKNGFKLSLRGYDPLFDHRASPTTTPPGGSTGWRPIKA
jgi:hypothetical protein